MEGVYLPRQGHGACHDTTGFGTVVTLSGFVQLARQQALNLPIEVRILDPERRGIVHEQSRAARSRTQTPDTTCS